VPKEACSESMRGATNKNIYHVLAIAVGLVAIDIAVRFTPEGLEHWHYVLHRLYYLAIISAGLRFGWSGGLTTAVFSGISYLSQNGADSPDARNVLDRYLESAVFCMVGLLAGILADRERQQREKTENARAELEFVHQELQKNLEHVKRAARMSALGHLSAGLAHEIRNPLAAIEGAAAIIQAEPEREDRRTEFLEVIQKESRRLNRLVTDFLEFAKPRAPELQSVTASRLIASVVALVKQTAARHLVEFDVRIAEGMPPLECDAEQIKQVLLNLLLNAVQAMPQGGKLELTAIVEDGLFVIRVRDTGPGIPQLAVDSIYDPFFTTKTNGTGLGLPVAYRIAQQHGGDLVLEENGPEGACFALMLPRSLSEAHDNISHFGS
jgi:two-component system, NtrC family, sensor histidine kinase HydH